MPHRRRSPFGELVYQYRSALNLTQSDLVRRVSNPQPGLERGTLSLRTLQMLERLYPAGSTWSMPRKATVAALADALNLEPGSSRWNDFVAASQLAAPEGAVNRPAHRAVQTADRIATPSPVPTEPPLFVPAGREPQLARLQSAISRLDGNQPGFVFVSAEPGTGKTALISHACREAVRTVPDLVVLWGECAANSAAADPHQAFRQALALMAGDIGTASPAHLVSGENTARLAQRVPRAIEAILDHGPSLIDRFVTSDSLSARINETPSRNGLADRLASPDPGAGPQGLNEQVFRTFAHYAKAGPTILVLEDLHWADIGTAAIVFHLVRRLYQQAIPLLVIGSYRSSDLHEDPFRQVSPMAATVREAHRYYSDPAIDLSSAVGGGAGQSFVEAMVSSSIPDAPSGFALDLFKLTGGLPLFVVALLHWYKTEGPLAATPATLSSLGRQSGRLPGRLEHALAYLINRLPPNLQSILSIASVQGNVVSIELLQEITGLSRMEITDIVERQLSQRYRILAPAGTSTTVGKRSHDYQFSHSLLQDVLYGQLTDLEREHHHAATARAMVAAWGDEAHAGTARIAYHFGCAGEDRAAAEFTLKAGNHYLEVQEYDLARAAFLAIREMDPAVSTPFLAASALVGLGNCSRGNGDLADARARLNDAIDHARRHRLHLVHANALTSLAMIDFDAGQMAVGATRLSEAAETLIAHGSREEACRALYLLSHTLLALGRYDEAGQRARQAMDIARDQGNNTMLVGAMIALANTRIELGQHDEAVAMYRACLDVPGMRDNHHRVAVCWLNISLAHIEQGRIREAREALDEVFALRQRIPARLTGAAEFNLGVCEESAGNLRESGIHYQASLDIRNQVGQDALAIDSLAGLTRIALATGEQDLARQYLAEVDRRIGQHGLEGIEHFGRLFLTRYRGHGAIGNPSRAASVLNQALDILRQRATLLLDPADRHDFLNNVPTHRELIEHGKATGSIAPGDPLLSYAETPAGS